MDEVLIRKAWSSIQSLEKNVLQEYASSLCNLHNSEHILGLQPMTDLIFPEMGTSPLFSKKPSFKHLSGADILFLRKCIISKEKTQETTSWAEFLLRYLEINRSSIIKKAKIQFGSMLSGRMALLELIALMMDIYFEWDDLRYLNLALKFMDMTGIYSLSSLPKNMNSLNKKLPLILIQIRLMILRQAAIKRIIKS